MATIIVVPHKNVMWNAYTWLSSISFNHILKDYWKRGSGNWKYDAKDCILCILWKCWQERLAGQGWAGLVSTGVQCVDWSCYDGHRPDPIRWYQPASSQAPLPRTLQQLDQSPAAFGAEIMTHNLILENGLMSWHEMRAVQDEQPGLAPWQQLLL